MQRFAAATATGLAALFASGSALAQDNAVRSAADAFGERVGIEQLGLYNEGQVRGFDLQSGGAYRINDAYFVRASPLNDPVLAGVGVRVGVNAARLPYPAPSGVVNYRLREPSATNQLNIGVGLREYATQTVEANGSWRADDDRVSLTAGLVVRPYARWAGGNHGEGLDFGVVGRIKLTETQRLTAFATIYERDYNGDYSFRMLDPALPPNPRQLYNYNPDGARVNARNANLGLLYAGEIGGWTVDASAFRSIYDLTRADFTVLSLRADGTGSAALNLTPARTNISDAGELRLSRVFTQGEISHLVSGSLRARRSTVDLASVQSVPIGPVTLRGPTPDAPPLVWSGTRGKDLTEQITASLGYGLVWADRLQLRLGVHRTRYEKTVDTLAGVTTKGEDQATLYNASVIWSLTPRTSLFASWVTGLEETGVAPLSATNGNEVLPPVESEQRDIGIRQALGENLTLIAAAFEVSRPTMAFRADGSFGLVGEVAHRGVEASLTGRIGERTSIVLGAVGFEAEVTGDLVDAGVIGSAPPGISTFLANASIERQLSERWSVDAQLNRNGERWADSRNTFKTPAVTTLNLGLRRRFEIGGRPVVLRMVAANVTNERGYWANPSLLFSGVGPRTVRASVTVTF